MGCILFVNLEGRIGGAETSLLELVRQLRGELVVKAACPLPGSLSKALGSVGIEVYRLPETPRHRFRSLKSALYFFKACVCILRIVLQSKPDVIHANSFRAGLVTVPAVLVTGTRFVLHARELKGLRPFTPLLGIVSDKVIAVSKAVKQTLINQGISPGKIRVIYNGTDQLIGNDSQTFPARRYNGVFVYAQIGQLVPWKNNTAFIKAAGRVAAELPESGFLLVGDDIFGRNHDYKKTLLKYISSSPASDRFSVLGWRQDLPRLWNEIDCLVHTCKTEPFGRVIIEAMAHKVHP